MKLAWATDIHLNFLTVLARRRFLESVADQADALVVTGDIANRNRTGKRPNGHTSRSVAQKGGGRGKSSR